MSILRMTPSLEHCQPRLKASLRPGFIRIYCERNGAPAVRIHMRYAGGPWHLLLDACDSPYIEDHTPVEVPGREEVREYRATAICGGEEVGQPSEPVKVAVPG